LALTQAGQGISVEDLIVDSKTSKIYIVEKRPSEGASPGIGTLVIA
jgi:hypothetical protein